MAMLHDVRSRQLSSIGNNDGGFYTQAASMPSTTAPSHYGYYRQHSPPINTTHIGTSPQSYSYVNREMEFFGNNNDYRMYPPSPPIQNMAISQPASVNGIPTAQYQYQAPGYVRAVPPDMFQPIDALPRLSVPGTTVTPIAHPFNRLPSPFGHHEGVHPATQRRSSTLPGLRKTGKRSHSCMVCGKVFARPSALQTHLYSHTGEKPFKCEHAGCGRSFSVVSNLRRHARVHKD